MGNTMNTFAEQFPELALPCTGEVFPDPQILVLNEPLAAELGLDPQWLRSPEGIAFLTGQHGGHALGYAGHQFGQFNPRMGDGRALLLSEHTDPQGEVWDIHAKGTGRTPFSRGGDGHYPLDAALKEYAFAESLHALGVPTARSLAVLSTGRTVRRHRLHPGAVGVRVAGSHIRIGTFQYAALMGPQVTERLVDYTLARHFPQGTSPLDLFDATVSRQAELVASWMRFGFIHGVMNTDNIAISGETIDFGPCAFMDYFATNTVYSSIDTRGRYAYAQQPAIMMWNLARLAEALVPLVDEGVKKFTERLQHFQPQYAAAWDEQMTAALGASECAEQLLDLLQVAAPDYSALLANLIPGKIPQGLETTPGAAEWTERWTAQDPHPRNPIYLPRNHGMKAALEQAEAGNLSRYLLALEALCSPFEWDDKYKKLGLHAAVPREEAEFTTYCGT